MDECLNDFNNCSFDTVVKNTLQLIGVSSAIITLVAIVFIIQSWIGPAKSVARGVAAAGSAIGRVAAHPPTNPLMAMVLTLVVLISQALTLALCFLGGNYIALGFDQSRWASTWPILESNGIVRSFSPDVLSEVLRWDPISTIYVALAFVLIAYSWKKSFQQRNPDLTGIGAGVALPATILLVMAGIGLIFGALIFLFGLVIAIFNGDAGSYSKDQFLNFLPLLVGGAICLLYFLACQAGVRGSKVVAWAWQPSIQQIS
jgi:hypothetical protein